MTEVKSDNLSEDSLSPKKGLNIKMGWPLILVLVVLVGLGGASFYFYSRYQHAQRLLKDPAAAAQEETRVLVEKVARHILLPKGETPTIAKVTDAKQLADNPFFAQAQTGDVVMIFLKAKKVVLFRPDADRIVNIGPFNSEPSVAGTSSATMQLQTARLTIYNGTQTAGLASVAEKKIKGELADVQTVSKLNSKGTYTKTRVVVLTPEAQTLGAQLADMFKTEVTSVMPLGEAKPESELLLIVGQDFQPK
jgi:hypothetical protein